MWCRWGLVQVLPEKKYPHTTKSIRQRGCLTEILGDGRVYETIPEFFCLNKGDVYYIHSCFTEDYRI